MFGSNSATVTPLVPKSAIRRLLGGDPEGAVRVIRRRRGVTGPVAYASSKIARRGFCGGCGTPLTFEYLDSPRMDLSLGSLDEPGRLRP